MRNLRPGGIPAALLDRARRLTGGRRGHRLVLDYPPAAPGPRPARPRTHLRALIAAGEPRYRQTLEMIASYGDDLARIDRDRDPSKPSAPAWDNSYLPGLDAAALYSYIRSRAPRTYLEVGSGNSTLFARRAIDDAGLETRIVSIDPSPRAEVDRICDLVERRPLELVDPALFAGLGSRDVIFLDGSHRVFTGSDATVFFLDLLPELAPGVLVGVHDVFLPEDYPEEIAGRYYSEQYLLAALLLGEPAWLVPTLAAAYVTREPGLGAALDQLWDRPGLERVAAHGGAFWFELGTHG